MPRYDVPVVRAEGKLIPGGVTLTPELLLEHGNLLVVSSSRRTRDAEAALGLDRSVYFYVGRACPDFGDMIFAFKAEATYVWTGTATPFDSGGIFRDDQGKRYIFPDGVPPPEGGSAVDDDASPNAAARAYVDHHKCGINEWQERFGQTLAKYFNDSISRYLSGETPDRDDPTGRHHLPAHQEESGHFRGRAWTWELQVAHDVTVLQANGWSQDLVMVCFAWDRVQQLRNWVRKRKPASEGARARLWNRLERSPIFHSGDDLNSSGRAADLVRERILEWLQ